MNISFAELHSCANYSCVLRFFFFFSSHKDSLIQQMQWHRLNNTILFAFVFVFWCGARIDNNRREYFAHRAAQLCVHACVLRFFSLFSLKMLNIHVHPPLFYINILMISFLIQLITAVSNNYVIINCIIVWVVRE